MTPVEVVMAAPEGERLEIALEYLRELSGGRADRVAWWQARFGLTKGAALMCDAINARYPRVVTREQILDLVESAGGSKLVDVLVGRVRRAGVPLVTVWGLGYRMGEKVEAGAEKVQEEYRARRKEAWTPEDDAELLRMRGSGSCISAIAEELDRTERGVMCRIERLRNVKAA